MGEMQDSQPSQAIESFILERAAALGFSLAGWIEAQPARRLDAYFDWIGANMHGEMGYLARPDRQARRKDLNVILPGVQSIISVGLDYYSLNLPADIANDPDRGRISNYAWGVDYHDLMTPRLHQLAEEIKQHLSLSATDISHKVYVDTGAILERDHAEAAGLGFTGKNTMLIHPRRGSWFFLGEILLTYPLTPPQPKKHAEGGRGKPDSMPSCGTCRRCLDACPTDAFPRPFVLDARRCISYLTIELKDSIPRELRPLIGNWIYGCDICQAVCPFNRFAQLTPETDFTPRHIEEAAPKLERLLSLSPSEFKTRFEKSPIKRIKWHRFMRNVAVAAGNSGNRVYLPQLEKLLFTANSDTTREHAAWAIGQLGGIEILSRAKQHESAANVQLEIDVALQNG